jgi:hypothetical protein
MIFGETNVTYKMCALIFIQILSEIYLILKRIERDIIIKSLTSLSKDFFFYRILKEFEFFQQPVEKFSIVRFYYNLPMVAELFMQTERQTDKHGDVNSRFLQFCLEYIKMDMIF